MKNKVPILSEPL